ncbi:InlB B-repeat-containing protein [Cohnella hongkongensis]|uniref:InlB B-repeat-containing protein n=1 Tax=Cohnella hongkongensis TaxID=178337 RepID=A0ABV9FC83_9BACL
MQLNWKKARMWILSILVAIGGVYGAPTPAKNRAHAATSQWGPVGDGSFSAGGATHVSMSIDNGMPYVAYSDWTNGYKVTVMKYNGSGWELVGNPGFSAGAAVYITIQVDNGIPYVAYIDQGDGDRAKVMKFENGNWTHVGGSVSDGKAGFISFYMDNGTPYVAFQDQSSTFRGTAKRYNGSGGWDMLGGGHFTSIQVNETSLYVDNGNLYIAYQLPMQSSRVSVVRLNGNSWQTVGNAGFSAGRAEDLSLFVHAGTPYVAYVDSPNGSRATVAKFNGTEWEMLGGAGFTPGGVDYTSLSLYNGTPYIAFQNSDYRATVLKYSGTGWETVGNASFSAGGANFLSLRFYDGVPYVAYQDHVGTSMKVSVSKLRPTVAYDGNGSTGGTVPASAGYDKNATVTVSGNTGSLTKTGYEFAGWNTEADGSGTPYAAGNTFAMGTEGVTLYAQWTLGRYPVTYDGNGGTGGTVPAAVNHDYNSVVTVQGNTGSLTRTGYSFAGWNTEANGSGTAYGAGATFTMGTEGVTLYAQWTINSYAVTYDGNGNTGGSVPAGGSYDYNSSVTVQGNSGHLVRTGHTFAGWNTEANGSGTAYGAGATFPMGAADVTLYARWTIDSYPVTYDGNGSTGGTAPAAAQHEYQSSVTVQGNTGNLTRTGYSFAGWNTEANGSGTSYGAGSTFPMGTQGVALYAQWTINSYAVVYDGNGSTGGSVPAGGSYVYNSSVTVQGNTGNLTKTGHTFAGWNTAADGSGTNYEADDSFTLGAANVTLFAKWTANSYAIAYDGNGNDEGSAPAGSSHFYGTGVVVPDNTGNLVKTGYTFAGWNTASDGLGTAYGAGATFSMGAADMTLYAVWTINSYPVSYDGNGSTGGSAPAESPHDYGSVVSVQSSGSLVKAGHTFVGWNTEPDGSGTAYVEGDEFPIGAAGVTLYAQWSINSYEVRFDSDGGTAIDSQTVVYGYTASEPDAPEKTGYTFGGWFTDGGFGSEFSFATAIEGDTTLYAKWNINSYTVAYDGNGSTGGSAPAGSTHEYESVITVEDNVGGLEKTGHTFAGWNTAEDGSGIAYAAGNPLTIGTAGVTLFAQWTVNSYPLSYQGNGNAGGIVPEGGSYDYGALVAVPDNTGGLEKPGYTFAGWNTAADGSGTAYRPGQTFAMGDGALTLYAQWLSNNALLSSLAVDAFVLEPAFSPSILNYEVRLAYEETGLSLSYSHADPTQLVSVTGAVYQSVTGTVYHYRADDLPVGSNPIRIEVTAQDGTVNSYTVTAVRDPGNDASLSGLTLSAGTLSPAFAPGRTTYSAGVSNGVSALTVAATATDPLASIAVNGQPVIGGQPSAEIPLAVGSNPISVEVTARDGTKKTYSITVNRASSGGGGPVMPPAAGGTTSTNGQLTLPAGQKGEVSLGDAIKVSIPAGATGKELKASIEEKPDAPSLPSGYVPVSPFLWMTSNATEPLSMPATVTLVFDSAKVKGNPEVAVFAYDETEGKWKNLDGVRVTGNRIEVEMNRLQPIVVAAFDEGTQPSAGPGQSFGDIAGHWAEERIKLAVVTGIVSGYPDGTFRPNQTVTRAEFAVLLIKALDPKGEGSMLAFADRDKIGAWAQQAVARAAQAGWIKGYSDGSFRPNAEITRAEMAAMIASAMGKLPDAGATTRFADDNAIPKWAKGAANALQDAELIQGKGSGEFDPFGKTTRAEAVTVLINLLEWQRQR